MGKRQSVRTIGQEEKKLVFVSRGNNDCAEEYNVCHALINAR